MRCSAERCPRQRKGHDGNRPSVREAIGSGRPTGCRRVSTTREARTIRSGRQCSQRGTYCVVCGRGWTHEHQGRGQARTTGEPVDQNCQLARASLLVVFCLSFCVFLRVVGAMPLVWLQVPCPARRQQVQGTAARCGRPRTNHIKRAVLPPEACDVETVQGQACQGTQTRAKVAEVLW